MYPCILLKYDIDKVNDLYILMRYLCVCPPEARASNRNKENSHKLC